MNYKHKLKHLAIYAALLLVVACGSTTNTNKQEATPAPGELRIGEGFTNPLGYFNASPSFSWKLPVSEKVLAQKGYRIVVASKAELLPDNADLWDSKMVESNQSVWIKYQGSQLQSRQKAFWQVMYKNQDDISSEWSETANFELGLLNNSDWQAKWISIEPEAKRRTTKEGYFLVSPQYLRKNFELKENIAQARLYITAKGVFEAQINGQKVGQDNMTPGFTPYAKRIETLTYDATKLIKGGQNTIGIMLSEGWYSGRIGFREQEWLKEKPLPEAICQLEVTYKNGNTTTITTDSQWKATKEVPIRNSSIYDGETYDANFEMPNWSKTEFNDEKWTTAIQKDLDTINLVPKRHSTVINKMVLNTQTITEPEKGRIVFDLGQNMVGVPQINIPVKKNQKVTIRYAEMLKQDGTMYTESYRSAKSIDFYTPKEDGIITWQPKFTFHGFRFVELSGFDESAKAENSWVKGIVQYSDFEKIGTFNSSHKKLNQLQSNINWGMRSNFFDIPTDCPQRDERLGWTGDAQVIAPTSIFNFDVYPFWAAWLQSVREDQAKDGSVPFIVPNVMGKTFSSGWADAATVIPWEVYFRTGDKTILEDNYDMMKALVSFYKKKSPDYISNVNTFGDWLQPYPIKDNRGDTPKELIGTAYFARSINLTIQAAQVLGKQDDIATLKSLRDSVRYAFAKKFIDKDGKLTTEHETQTAYLMTLGFELVSNDMAKKVFPHLLRKIEDADNHLRTGFLGTPLLSKVLDKYGRSDLMYQLLFKETYPSWFYSINQGATTMWERWNSYSHDNGFGDVSMNSFNHYAYGAIGRWMYETIAGLSAIEPGYKKIRIAPVLGSQLEFAEAEYNSIYGKIASSWKKTANGLEIGATVAPNTTAEIILPIDKDSKILLDGKDVADQKNISIVNRDDNKLILNALPGTYKFTIEK